MPVLRKEVFSQTDLYHFKGYCRCSDEFCFIEKIDEDDLVALKDILVLFGCMIISIVPKCQNHLHYPSKMYRHLSFIINLTFTQGDES